MWEGKLIVKKGVAFMTSPNLSSLVLNRSHLKEKGPGLTRGSNVSAGFEIGLINYSWLHTKKLFSLWSLNIIKSELLTKFQVIWTRIRENIDFTIFDQINKFDKPQILCSPLFPEWVDLRTNASGFMIATLVPSNNTSFI